MWPISAPEKPVTPHPTTTHRQELLTENALGITEKRGASLGVRWDVSAALGYGFKRNWKTARLLGRGGGCDFVPEPDECIESLKINDSPAPPIIADNMRPLQKASLFRSEALGGILPRPDCLDNALFTASNRRGAEFVRVYPHLKGITIEVANGLTRVIVIPGNCLTWVRRITSHALALPLGICALEFRDVVFQLLKFGIPEKWSTRRHSTIDNATPRNPLAVRRIPKLCLLEGNGDDRVKVLQKCAPRHGFTLSCLQEVLGLPSGFPTSNAFH